MSGRVSEAAAGVVAAVIVICLLVFLVAVTVWVVRFLL